MGLFLKLKLEIVTNKNMKIKITLFIAFLTSFLMSFSQCPTEVYKTVYPTGPADPTIAIFSRCVYVDQNNVIYSFLDGGYGSGINFILRQNGLLKDTIQFAGNELSKIRLDNNNNIHISTGDAIYKYVESLGNWSLVAGGNGYGSESNQLSNAKDFFIDTNNDIYVADFNNHRVQKWSNGSNFGITVAGGNDYGTNSNQIPYPSAIYLNSFGEIFVADNSNRIQKWIEGQTSGVTVAGGNGSGSALNQFDGISSFVINDANEILVADQNNHRIMKWLTSSSNGSIYFGGIGNGNTLNHISYPSTLSLSNSGEIFASSNAKIIKIPSGYVLPSGNLNVISTSLNFGESTKLNVSLIGNSPFNFKINDVIFNNISLNSFVHTITPGKNTTYTLKELSDQCGTVKSSGVVNVNVNNSPCTSEIYKLATSNTITSDSVKFKDFSIWNNTEIYGIDNFESAGQYVQRVVRKNLNDINGLATEVISSSTLFSSGGTNPARIFVDAFKNIYLRYYDSYQIRKWSPPYSSSTVVVNNFGNNYQSDFVVDSLGTIYASQPGYGDPSQIVKWENNPNLPIVLIEGTGTGQSSILKTPGGIILDNENNLIFTDIWDGSLKKVNTVTNTIQTLKTGLTYPSDVFINQNSEYFVVEGCDPIGFGSGSKRIRKFDKNGNFIMSIAENLNCPYNIGGDSTGKLFFRDFTETYVYQPPSTLSLSNDTTILQGDSAKITLNFNGIGPYSFSMNDSLFNNINQNPFEIKVSPSTSKTYTFEAFSSICGNGQILTNNEVEINVILCDAVAPTLLNDSVMTGNQVHINAFGCINGTINWYESQNSDEILFSGSTFLTPILNSTKSYFASCQTSTCESSSRAESRISVFNCPENHSFILDSPTGNNYNAFKSIVSSMPQNINTIFSSGNYIELKPGFKTLLGNTFQAQIGGCL